MMKKQVRFGETTAIANGPSGHDSLAQPCWDALELMGCYQEGLEQARLEHPDGEMRGLESHFQKGTQKRNEMYVKYVVLRYKKLAKVQNGDVALQEYSSKNTRVHQIKAHQRALRDQAEAKKIYELLLPTTAKKAIQVHVLKNRTKCVPVVPKASRACTVSRVISC